MSNKKERVAVVGASPNPERYSNKAVRLLLEHGHEVIPVHPTALSIEGIPVVRNLQDIAGSIDTVTLYITADRSNELTESLIHLNPGRVIFNPGTENATLLSALQAQGIPTEEACTLVLLRTGQY